MHEGYEELRCAIVKQAVIDYRRALKFGGSRYEAEYFERWFLSDWGQTLSCNNGARIIEIVKKEVTGDMCIKQKKRNRTRTNLLLFRENLGLSKISIAKIIGCSASYYGQVENGIARGSDKFWHNLQEAYPKEDITELMENDR